MSRYPMQKWSHYFEAYRREFGGLEVCSLLEIGVAEGGSLAYWISQYPEARIYGIDIDPRCVRVSGSTVFIGNQANRSFLRDVVRTMRRPQIIIDDGSHHPRDQRISFEELWPVLDTPGVYCIEDLHTRFKPLWKFGNYGGDTFWFITEQIKYNMHLHWKREMTGDLVKVVFVDSMVFLHKGEVSRPVLMEEPPHAFTEHFDHRTLP